MWRFSFGLDAKGLGQTRLNLTRNLIGDHYEYGALFSYGGTPEEIIIRVGVSFLSTDQACANAESDRHPLCDETVEAQTVILREPKRLKNLD